MMGSSTGPTVFMIAAAQPLSKAEAISSPVAVGGAEAKHQGFSISKPKKGNRKSAIASHLKIKIKPSF
jgi:hypothetical protein